MKIKHVAQRRTSPRKKKVTFSVIDELLEKPHQSTSTVNHKSCLKKATTQESVGVKRDAEFKSGNSPKPKRPCSQSVSPKQNIPKFPSLYTRMSPNSLFHVIECLNYHQFCALEEIGFSGLFWLRVKQLPLQLGYWLVNNFDPFRNCLPLPESDRLAISSIDVHATLGLPMGPKKVELCKSVNESEELASFYVRWKAQFGVDENQITLRTLVSHLSNQKEANDDFKINFVLLVVSLLVRNNQKSFVNTHVLKSLTDAKEIINYNWCEFVMSSLREAKVEWERKKVNFCGPILFLILVYVDRVVRGSRTVERDFYTLASWTTGQLNAREKEEMDCGRFGDGFVVAPMEECVDLMCNPLPSPSDNHASLQGSNPQLILKKSQTNPSSSQECTHAHNLPSDSGITFPSEETTTFQSSNLPVVLKKSPTFYSSPKEYKQEYTNVATQMARTMVQLEEITEVGERFFPNDPAVTKLHSSTELLYKTYGGAASEDDQNMLINNVQEENDMIEYCDAVVIALNKKRAIQKLRDRFAALQRGELLSRHNSLLRSAFEGLKLDKSQGFDNDLTKKDVLKEVEKETSNVEVYNEVTEVDTDLLVERGVSGVEVVNEVSEVDVWKEVTKVVREVSAMDVGKKVSEVEKEASAMDVGTKVSEAQKEVSEIEVVKEISAKENVSDLDVKKSGVTEVDDGGADTVLMAEAETENAPEHVVKYRRLRTMPRVGMKSTRKSPRFTVSLCAYGDQKEIFSADVGEVELDVGGVDSLKSGDLMENANPTSLNPAVRSQIQRRFPRKRTDTGLRPFYPHRTVLQKDTSVTRPLTPLHEAIVDYIYSHDMKSKALASEYVFLVKGVLGTRLDFLKFMPPNHLNDNILDCWSCYLNFQEKDKSLDAPNRFFSGTLAYILGTREGNKSKDGQEFTDEERFKSFDQVLTNELGRYEWINLESIDMFFFPVIREEHIYLFVFDLLKKRLLIIDNYSSRGSIEVVYGVYVNYMIDNLAYYLGERGYKAKSNLVINMVPQIVRMPWRNNSNIDDCGIYTMRHMETFMGLIRGWQCGLSKNDMSPLRVLRMKYLCTLIGFKENECYDDVAGDAKRQWLCNRDRVFKY